MLCSQCTKGRQHSTVNSTGIIKTPDIVFFAVEYGIHSWEHGNSDPIWPLPPPIHTDSLATSVYTAFEHQTKIGWNQTVRVHLALTWGDTMSIYHKQRFPKSKFTPSQWTCPLLNTLCVHASEQWDERNSFIHGATLQANRAKHTCFLISNISTAYQNQHLVNLADHQWSHLFGLPLSQRLLHTPSAMEAWLTLYKTGQHLFASQIARDERRQGNIRQYLIQRNAPCRPAPHKQLSFTKTRSFAPQCDPKSSERILQCSVGAWVNEPCHTVQGTN